MPAPKKKWVLTNEEVINEKKDMPKYWVRIVVDGKAFYVPSFSEEDWER